MTTPCLTDYISIDNLQTFLDESSQQDGIALRLWSPKKFEKEESGWVSDSWNNACQFHTLIRTYPSGKEVCYQYFSQKADEIIQNKDIKWHVTMCPTSLYIFGWPIYDSAGKVLAILFGGLVRDPIKRENGDEWRKVKNTLKDDRAVLQELENEYCHVPSFTKKQRKHLFSKWKLFCQFLSSHLSKGISIKLSDEYWVEWLISFHSCSTIARNLTKVKKVRKFSVHLTVIDKSADHAQKKFYHLKITNKVQLTDIEKNNNKLSKKLIPITQSNRICLSFDKNMMKRNGKGFYWKVSRNIISGILIDHLNKKIAHRKLLLEQQAQVFKEVYKNAVNDLESMIEELFNQLRIVGIINIEFASFSEVIYLPDKEENSKPYFKARVTYPKKRWSTEQCKIIEKLDLSSDKLISHGSTVLAFQKSRSVLDRNVKKSSTYVMVQPDVCSSLVIPINHGSLVLGVIAFDSTEKNYFNNERKLLLENLTQLISPVVYHNKFQETLQTLNQNIQNSAQELTKHSKKDIRKYILRALCSLVQAEAASYWEQNRIDGETLYRGMSIGEVDQFKCEIKIQGSTLGDLFSENQNFVLVHDLQKKYKELKSADSLDKQALSSLKYLISRGVFSYLAFPVIINRKKIIISFYRFDNELLSHREFSSIELNITQRLGKILSFYEYLNQRFDEQRNELEIQLESRKELAITLAHNIKSPLSSTYARLDELQRRLKNSIGKTYYSENFNSSFNAINSNFAAIKRSTNPILKQLAMQESYNVSVFSIQPFHLYYDILTRQISRVRRGLKINPDRNENGEEPSLYKRVIEFSGHRQFPLLFGDKSAIEDMISNLLENAVKYSEEESKISIETYFDYVSREIKLLIKNEGLIYIPEEDKERIFDYAYRAKIARDKDPDSTGVGLYYSRYIANQHGATLSVDKFCNPVTIKLVIPVNLLYSAKKAEETLKNINLNTKDSI